MEILLQNGDTLGVHESDLGTLNLLLHAVKEHGGIGMVTDAGDSYALHFEDPKEENEKREANREAGRAANHLTRWTARDRYTMVSWFYRGEKISEIAKMLERTLSSTKGQLFKMGLLSPEETKRLQGWNTIKHCMIQRKKQSALMAWPLPEPVTQPETPRQPARPCDLMI